MTTYSTIALSLACALLSIGQILMAQRMRRLEIHTRRITRSRQITRP